MKQKETSKTMTETNKCAVCNKDKSVEETTYILDEENRRTVCVCNRCLIDN